MGPCLASARRSPTGAGTNHLPRPLRGPWCAGLQVRAPRLRARGSARAREAPSCVASRARVAPSRALLTPRPCADAASACGAAGRSATNVRCARCGPPNCGSGASEQPAHACGQTREQTHVVPWTSRFSCRADDASPPRRPALPAAMPSMVRLQRAPQLLCQRVDLPAWPAPPVPPCADVPASRPGCSCAPLRCCC